MKRAFAVFFLFLSALTGVFGGIGVGSVWPGGGGAPGVAHAGTGEAGAAVFLKNSPDIPLMPGFSEIEDESLVFDKPDGKIAVSVAISSPVAAGKVRDFYHETLPQLGWTAARGTIEGKEAKDTYIRGEERLRLSIEENPRKTTLRFELAPQNPAR